MKTQQPIQLDTFVKTENRDTCLIINNNVDELEVFDKMNEEATQVIFQIYRGTGTVYINHCKQSIQLSDMQRQLLIQFLQQKE